MFNDDEGPKDWEIRDEEPPESLRRKWEKEETFAKTPVICSSCKKETPAENLTCIFCGADLDFKNKSDQCCPNDPQGKEMKRVRGAEFSREKGPAGYFLKWLRSLFRKV